MYNIKKSALCICDMQLLTYFCFAMFLPIYFLAFGKRRN